MELVSRIEERLWPANSRRHVWMIVDTARDPRAYRTLLEGFYTQHVCLYAGELAPELQMAAPYLVELEREDTGTRKLIRRAWGNSWGVFLVSNTSQASLRRHLRSLLVVRDERGHRLLFRYYDPRVLRMYLPTCTAEELQTVFGPIDRILIEGEAAGKLLEFSLERGRLITAEHDIPALEASGPPDRTFLASAD